MYLDNRPVVHGGAVAVPAVPAEAARTGSLWRDHVAANFLFADVKARYPGDLLTIVVSETASGSKDAETSTKTKTTVSGSLSEFFGFPQQLQKHHPNVNPAALIEADADREWDGQGATSRSGKLSALMTAQVTEVAANGNLWVEGEKIVSVNHEAQHLAIAGWVRPEDVDAQNQVLSSRIALGRIDYYGAGVVGMKQGPGWGYWLLDWVWPF
jgi:flagellar L-ring protein precursor FlgH